MNRIKSIFTIILLQICLSWAITAISQEKKVPDEKIVLFCDRTLYVSGEQILFTAWLINTYETTEPSRIVYSELVTPEGNKVTANKFLLVKGKTDGYLTIPADIISGYYYLKTYTRYMRNTGPSAYDYTLLKIINPDNPSVLTGKSSDSVVITPAEDALNNEWADNKVKLSVNSSKFTYRDTVVVYIDIPIAGLKSIKGLCMSVVPEKSQAFYKTVTPGKNGYIPENTYYRENKGLTLSGDLSVSKSGKLSASSRVNLVIIGKGRDFMASITDDKGRFFFALPDYTGFRDILLSADANNKDSLKLQIDNDFCSVQHQMPSPVFKLDSAERNIALQMVVNNKLNNVFPADTLQPKAYDKANDNAFYGKPDEVMIVDQYVQLASLEEYFNELTTYAKVRKSHGKLYFKVIGPQPDLNKYEPLVMVDWVAIDDPARILAISPQNVARIEIINHIYVKGDFSYGGIISIVSKHGDFAGIDLPPSSIFVNYRFLAEDNPRKFINFNLPHHPDARNTLCWTSDIATVPGKTSEIRFTTSDNPGKYLIFVRGLMITGETFTRIFRIEVSK